MRVGPISLSLPFAVKCEMRIFYVMKEAAAEAVRSDGPSLGKFDAAAESLVRCCDARGHGVGGLRNRRPDQPRADGDGGTQLFLPPRFFRSIFASAVRRRAGPCPPPSSLF